MRRHIVLRHPLEQQARGHADTAVLLYRLPPTATAGEPRADPRTTSQPHLTAAAAAATAQRESQRNAQHSRPAGARPRRAEPAGRGGADCGRSIRRAAAHCTADRADLQIPQGCTSACTTAVPCVRAAPSLGLAGLELCWSLVGFDCVQSERYLWCKPARFWMGVGPSTSLRGALKHDPMQKHKQ